MKKNFVGLGALLVLTGCQYGDNGLSSEDSVDQTFTAEMASQTITQAFKSNESTPVFMACGPAAGKGLYDNDGYGDFQSDGISNGRLIFLAGNDGTAPDVVIRDSGGNFISSRNDGADVQILDTERRVWIVAYPSTGVVETHNFISRNGHLVDLWTSNKPAVSAWGPSAKIFMSNCIRP